MAARGAISALLLLAASVARPDPLPARDQNPLLSGFGIPVPLPARVPASSKWSFALDLNWSSTAFAQSKGAEALIVDAESRELRATLTRALAEHLVLRVQVPYRVTDAGILDGFIDSWHELLGLPEGARGEMPQDDLRIAYARSSVVQFDLESATAGLADSAFALGYQLVSTPTSALAAWAELKLPTGDSDELTGSGAADGTIALAAQHRFHDRWSIFAQGALSWLGQGDRFDAQQRRTAWSGVAGLSWRAWRGLELTVQLDGHTSLLKESRVAFFRDALALTAGGSYRFDSGWEVRAAVSEDMAVNTVPDVVFMLGVARRTD